MPMHESSPVDGELVLYDTACRAVAEAKSVDEVLQIRDANAAPNDDIPSFLDPTAAGGAV